VQSDRSVIVTEGCRTGHVSDIGILRAHSALYGNGYIRKGSDPDRAWDEKSSYNISLYIMKPDAQS